MKLKELLKKTYYETTVRVELDTVEAFEGQACEVPWELADMDLLEMTVDKDVIVLNIINNGEL